MLRSNLTPRSGRWNRPLLCALLTIVMLLMSILAPRAEAEGNSALDSLLPSVGSALVEAGQQEWSKASEDLNQFKQLWEPVKAGDTDHADLTAAVDAALQDAKSKLASGGPEAKTALSALAKAVNAYVTAAESPSGSTGAAISGVESAKKLLPLAQDSLKAMQAGDWDAAKRSYQSIVDAWPTAETPIRSDNFTVYGQLETGISLVRIALQAEPVREEQAVQEMQKLTTLMTGYTEGKIAAADAGSDGNYRLSDVLGILETARQDAQAGRSSEAADQMTKFISIWPAVEGEVRVSAPDLYTDIENKMSAVSGYLLSSPPKLDEAVKVMDAMKSSLTPLAVDHKYTAWDAALILLREGLEAILVLSALLSYLKRSGNTRGQKWIWGGAGSGLVLSLLLAVVLTFSISKAASGSARELIEGITGLVAVVMMLTVGQWLHSKSNTAAWNKYVGSQMDQALARGSLWSLFVLAGLAVLREGAETTIFYAGMASSIDMGQLILGIAGAFAVLAVLAYAIIVLSARLPLRGFFLAATVLIYYLVFRFLGDSIHSLQVSGRIPAHSETGLPSVSWLGMYPTWETFIPQMVVLAFVLWQLIRVELRNTQGSKARA